MGQKIRSAMAEGRFAALLAEEPAQRNLHDQPLLATADWIVAPTLGAIVPNWLIAVPRAPVLNFSQWRSLTGVEPTAIIGNLTRHLGIDSDRVLWFEHGPASRGTSVGCGVDYGHLHLILDAGFSFDAFMDHVALSSTLPWCRLGVGEAYGRLSGSDSYLMIGSGEKAAMAEGVEHTGSQFLRRMVASITGQDDGWNYRVHPHHENISRTIQTFRNLERAARGR